MRALIAISFVFSSMLAIAQDTQSPEAENLPQPSHFVSDELFIYMHSGPGTQYKILGSINAGDPLVVTDSEPRNGYIEVIDPKQRTGWVEEKFVSADASLRAQLEELRELQVSINQQLMNFEQQDRQQKEQISTMQQREQQMRANVSQLSAENSNLKASQDNKQHEEQMDWMIRGAGIAFIGVLLGLLLPHLARKKRKHDNWM